MIGLGLYYNIIYIASGNKIEIQFWQQRVKNIDGFMTESDSITIFLERKNRRVLIVLILSLS